MPVYIYERRKTSRRQADQERFKAFLIVGYIVCVMAGIFLGMQIERQINVAAQEIIKLNK